MEIDLDYKALQGYGLTPYDVMNTINAQDLILPSGTQKIGLFEYQVGLNASPDTMGRLNAIPIKTLPDGTTIRIRNVGPYLQRQYATNRHSARYRRQAGGPAGRSKDPAPPRPWLSCKAWGV